METRAGDGLKLINATQAGQKNESISCQNFNDSSTIDGSMSSVSENLIPLPENWKKAYTENGEPYYIDYSTGTSQWQDPRLVRNKYGVDENNGTDLGMNELPYGWEKIEDPHYGTYYIDHVNKITQYESPLAQLKRSSQEEIVDSTGWAPQNDKNSVGNNLNTSSKLCPDTSQKLPYIFTRNAYELKGEMIQTTLVKSARGFGFTIVGGDNGDVEEFLQIKNIVPHGPAWQNGMLQTGDVLVYVNNTCVLGYTHQDVVTLFQAMSPGDNVQLEVCRGYPLPFDLSDPNAEVVSTMAVSMTQSLDSRLPYNSTSGISESEKEGYYKMDEGSDSARSAKSMPDLRNSNPSKIQRHNSADILDSTTSEEMGVFNQQCCDTPEFISVEIIKGNNGFGFTIADSGCGQKVKKILDKTRCKSLQEGDILLEINGKSIINSSHTDVVLMLKECTCGEAAVITVQRGSLKGNQSCRTYESNSYQMDGNSNLLSQSLLLPDKIKQKDISVPSIPGSYRSKTPTADIYSSRSKESISVNRPKTPLVDTRNWSPTDNCQSYSATVDPELLSMWKTGFRIQSPNSQANWPVSQEQLPYWSGKKYESKNAQDCLPQDPSHLQSFKEIPEVDEDVKSVHSNNRSLYNTSNWNHNNLDNMNTNVQSGPKPPSRYPLEGNYPMYHSSYGDCHDGNQPPLPKENVSSHLNYQYPSSHNLSPVRTSNSFDQEQQPLLSKVLSDETEYMYSAQTLQEIPELNEMIVTLSRQQSGFGFRIVGGTEEGSQVSIGHIVPGGSADLDGRLRPGDEIISVDGQRVINTTHQHVVQLMNNASANGRVTLGIKRNSSSRNIDSLQGNVYPYNVTVTRKQNEGFGFVIISSVSRIGSTIGRILENSPAERCGQLRVGDRILAVNGISIINVHHGDIVNLIKDSGLSVTLTIGAPQDDEESSTTSNSQKDEELQRKQQRYHSVELLRGTRGFGFSIRGGREFQNMPLYVLRIAENGPAHQNGTLQVGDQIMEINGISTEEMTHSEAIDIIRQGGNTVYMLVKRHDKLPAVIIPYSMYPLHRAAEVGDYDTLRNLLQAGYSANSADFDGLTPLHEACLRGNLQCAELLFTYGARVDARSVDSGTPLCDACAGGSADCIRLLLRKGAEVNPSLLMTSPLHEASIKGNLECVELLIKAGAQLNAMDCHFGTPLHAATFMNHAKCAELLLRAGAFVNATKIHQTALHMAASHNHIDTARVLLEYGANVFALNNQNKKPIELLPSSSGLFYEELLKHETTPRDLQEICRHVLRSHIGPMNLEKFAHRYLPKPLASYITYVEL